MADHEFYRPQETGTTLKKDRPTTLSQDRANQRKESQRTRRKREAAGRGVSLLAGAAAVVVLASTISDSPTAIASTSDYICPICSTVNCVYWDDYGQTEQLTLHGEYGAFSTWEAYIGSHAPEDIYPLTADNLMGDDIGINYNTTGGGITGLYLSWLGDYASGVTPTYLASGYITFREVASDASNPEFIAVALSTNEDGAEVFAQIEAEYEGNSWDMEFGDSNTATYAVDGYEGTWIHVFSDRPESEWGALVDGIAVRSIDDTIGPQTLGETMTITFDEDIPYVSDIGSFVWIHDGIDFDWQAAYITLNNIQIVLSEEDCFEQFDLWQQLNEEAASFGHTVTAPLIQIQDYTCNGITYGVFLTDDSAVAEWYNYTYYLLVPYQEPSVFFMEGIYGGTIETLEVTEDDQLEEVIERAVVLGWADDYPDGNLPTEMIEFYTNNYLGGLDHINLK